MGHALDALHAAYDVSGDDARWIRRVAAAALPELDAGRGCIAFFSERTADDVRLFGYEQVGGDEPLVPLARGINDVAGPRARIAGFASLRWNNATNIGVFEVPDAQGKLGRAGIGNVDGISAYDPTGAGVVLTFPHRGEITRPTALMRRWEHVGAHIAAGLRLRRTLSSLDDHPGAVLEAGEAVLGTDGRVVHARDAASEADVRERLRDYARALDRSHTRAGADARNADDTLRVLTGLVEGRYSVVDCFDSDGRRYYVALRNPHRVPVPTALSPRERTVLSHAAMGHSNKFIAWELGLAQSTVSGALKRAAQKLGVESATELLQLARAMTAQASGDPS